jgi:uncharacterized protein (UPF0218 family)
MRRNLKTSNTLLEVESSSDESENDMGNTRKLKPSFKGKLKLNDVKLKRDECVKMVQKHFKEERIDIEQPGIVTKQHLIDMVKKKLGLIMTHL